MEIGVHTKKYTRKKWRRKQFYGMINFANNCVFYLHGMFLYCQLVKDESNSGKYRQVVYRKKMLIFKLKRIFMECSSEICNKHSLWIWSIHVLSIGEWTIRRVSRFFLIDVCFENFYWWWTSLQLVWLKFISIIITCFDVFGMEFSIWNYHILSAKGNRFSYRLRPNIWARRMCWITQLLTCKMRQVYVEVGGNA